MTTHRPYRAALAIAAGTGRDQARARNRLRHRGLRCCRRRRHKIRNTRLARRKICVCPRTDASRPRTYSLPLAVMPATPAQQAAQAPRRARRHPEDVPMEAINILWIFVVAAAAVGAVAAWILYRRKSSKRLQVRFGPEYRIVVEKLG